MPAIYGKIITSNLTIHCGVSDGDFIGDSALSGCACVAGRL